MKKTHNQQMKNAFKVYNNSNIYDLWQLYKTYSHEKARAFEYCKNLCNKMGGKNLKILGGNCHTFSVGFVYPHEETGEAMFCYITRDNDRYGFIQKLNKAVAV